MAKKKKNETLPGKGIVSSLLEEEYLIHLDTDDDELYWAKEALKNALTPFQRKIYLTYVHNGTYTSAARAFGVAQPTMRTYIQGLQTIINEYICNHI